MPTSKTPDRNCNTRMTLHALAPCHAGYRVNFALRIVLDGNSVTMERDNWY